MSVPAKRVKESIIDLSKYLDQPVTVKFAGGREGSSLCVASSRLSSLTWLLRSVTGVLKGYDGLVNLVLDECREYIQGASMPSLTRLFADRPDPPTPKTSTTPSK
jgi:small nuclear ribonucleoprotein (snRNP)-like protein